MVPQDGIRYFVSGGGGRSAYEFKDQPGYVAAGGGFYHFLYVRLTRDRFEYYAIDRDGRTRDAGWWAKGDAADHPLPAGTRPPLAGASSPGGAAQGWRGALAGDWGSSAHRDGARVPPDNK
jgi:hypothetical protein